MEQEARIYRSTGSAEDAYLARLVAHVPDRPGSLEALAHAFGSRGVNIVCFLYNRSAHPNRVVLEVTSTSEPPISDAISHLHSHGFMDEHAAAARGGEALALGLSDAGSILRIEALLEHRPGSLAALAGLFTRFGANVIQMEYHEDVSRNSALISLIGQDARSTDQLLKEMNQRGMSYSIIYRGAGQREVDDIIGLNLAERFYLRLRALLGSDDVAALRKLVDSSRQMSARLASFSAEAGRHLEAGSVFTNVLAFATASRARTGHNFSYTRLSPHLRAGLALDVFRLPTGGSISIITSPKERVMIDCSYGLYFDDACNMLRAEGINPDEITRLYLTHADADHAGMSGILSRVLGTRVFLHPESEGIIRHRDRSYGTVTEYKELNRTFTELVDGLTSTAYPEKWEAFDTGGREMAGEFRAIDAFRVGGAGFIVLESMGGHIPGQVFFLSREAGIVFTGDYLLNVDSLSNDEKTTLNYPRFMMRSTNVNSSLFRREMQALMNLCIAEDKALAAQGGLLVVPGHGASYPASSLGG